MYTHTDTNYDIYNAIHARTHTHSTFVSFLRRAKALEEPQSDGSRLCSSTVAFCLISAVFLLFLF